MFHVKTYLIKSKKLKGDGKKRRRGTSLRAKMKNGGGLIFTEGGGYGWIALYIYHLDQDQLVEGG